MYNPILKAKQHEIVALKNLEPQVSSFIRPLFEIEEPTEDKKIRSPDSPYSTHVRESVEKILDVWPSTGAMVDGYYWGIDKTLEDGSHFLTYAINILLKNNKKVIPVIGYDRYSLPNYQFALKNILENSFEHVAIRIDKGGIEDSMEPEFLRNIKKIIEIFNLEPSKTIILVDSGDISTNKDSVSSLIDGNTRVISKLDYMGFNKYILCGSSIPPSVNLAVPKHDTDAILLRKEYLVYKSIRSEYGNKIEFGDYGIRNPRSFDGVSSRTNAKIRYTIKDGIFVVRGHVIAKGDPQVHGLCKKLQGTPHFLGSDFSWGDAQIVACGMRSKRPGNSGKWIEIDTNHHITFVKDEITDFERSLGIKEKRREIA